MSSLPAEHPSADAARTAVAGGGGRRLLRPLEAPTSAELKTPAAFLGLQTQSQGRALHRRRDATSNLARTRKRRHGDARRKAKVS